MPSPRIRRAVALLLALAALPITGAAALLLLVADTWPGRALGAGFLLLGLAAPLLPVARRAALPVGLALGLLACAWGAAPSAEERPFTLEPGLQSVWLGPATPSRWRLPWVTPERDQLVLASHLVWLVDPLLDRQESATFRRAARGIYDELAAEPSYARAGSALGLAYAELLGGAADAGHVYVDRAPGDGPQPAVLFLHGFGGAPVAYPWVLRRALHARGYALVAPSFGAGFWFEDGGLATIERTLAWMRASGAFDMDRVAVAGLSNGAYGVSAALRAHPEVFTGAAWLSGVLDARRVADVPVDRPLLVLHGAAEDRIPLPYATAAVDALRARGATVDLDVVEGADHFLVFTHRERLDAALGRWLAAIEASR